MSGISSRRPKASGLQSLRKCHNSDHASIGKAEDASAAKASSPPNEQRSQRDQWLLESDCDPRLRKRIDSIHPDIKEIVARLATATMPTAAHLGYHFVGETSSYTSSPIATTSRSDTGNASNSSSAMNRTRESFLIAIWALKIEVSCCCHTRSQVTAKHRNVQMTE